MNVEMICELLVAAEYLRIWPLLDLSSAALASYVKKKKPEEIKDMFGLKLPLRPISAAEEERIREEHSWCDEDWCFEVRITGKIISKLIHTNFNTHSHAYKTLFLAHTLHGYS